MKSLKIIISLFVKDFFFEKKDLKLLRINVFLNLLVAILELLGVGAIIFIVSDFFTQNNFFNYFLETENFSFTKNELIKFFLVMLIFKYFLQFFTYYFIFKNYKKIQNSFMNNLVSLFLNQKNSFYQKDSKTQFQNLFFNEIPSVFTTIYQSMVDLFNEVFLILLIIIFLTFFYGPVIIKISLFFLLILIIFLKLSSLLNNRLGYKKIQNTKKLFSNLKSIILNLDIIKIYLKQDYFKNLSKSNISKLLSATINNSMAGRFARVSIEFVIVFFACIYFLIAKNIETIQFALNTHTIVFFISCARLVPSLSRINIHFNKIHFILPAIKKITSYKNDLKNQKISKTFDDKKHIEFNQSIQINNLNLAYGQNTIFKDRNFEFEKNKKTLILGPSGSGKTSLISFILGLNSENMTGEILVDNVKVDNNSKNWLKLFGYIPQEIFLLNTSIAENIAFGEVKDIDYSRVVKILRIMNLDNLVSSNNTVIDYKIEEGGENLSGGEKQRIAIARALYFNKEIIVMDEPTSALDRKNSEKIMSDILKLKKTFIVISHDYSLQTSFDKVVKL